MSLPQNFYDFVEERVDADLQADALAHSSVICAATPGAPVIYVSKAFEAHTGYRPEEVIGRSLSFLRGPQTEADAIAQFRTLIRNGEGGTIRITNYRKDNTPFVHECEMRPIRNELCSVTHFVAIQRVVPDVTLEEGVLGAR